MNDLFGNDVITKLSLADKYLMCPTSILNKRDPKWQQLKRKWISLGIQSELGRNSGRRNPDPRYTSAVFKGIGTEYTTSIFDPVICEIIYKWFCPANGYILDPFAGGSVRGIVANFLGYKYTGIELRHEQVDSNREQSTKILPPGNQPEWYVGDSEIVLDNKWTIEFDLLFSCPPYMNLEVYSDLPGDLSNMKDDAFKDKYFSIINKGCSAIKKGGYAVFVVGDVRDSKGYYKDFTGMTKKAFISAGMKLYNELILIEPVGTKGMTLEPGFKNGKLAKVHQNIYIFKKPK